NDIKAKSGDTVEIQETRPLSARKHFTITKIIKK
ncbi:30S ribosomal protein S17, partial [Candidatus Collierbacteria bacterium CG09_land_8_20_14_0_10_46_12]